MVERSERAPVHRGPCARAGVRHLPVCLCARFSAPLVSRARGWDAVSGFMSLRPPPRSRAPGRSIARTPSGLRPSGTLAPLPLARVLAAATSRGRLTIRASRPPPGRPQEDKKTRPGNKQGTTREDATEGQEQKIKIIFKSQKFTFQGEYRACWEVRTPGTPGS